MSIKILGGVARNYSIITPQSCATRPTSVLLKRRLFDSIQQFDNKVFIDVCAGSGSIGFEALSRGAEQVIFIEKDFKNTKIIENNGKNLKQKFDNLGLFKVLNYDFKKIFKKESLDKYDSKSLIIFFDPPYELLELYESFFYFIFQSKISAKVIVEACEQKTMPLVKFQELYGEANKTFKQGTSYFAIYDI